jgi:glycine oxidase
MMSETLIRQGATVIGAGVTGSWQALMLARAGFDVTLHERSTSEMKESTGYWAGGMLAPYCEREATEPIIARLGLRSLDLWRDECPETSINGTLVVAHSRDRADYDRFAKYTHGYRRIDANDIAVLEPALVGRFNEALFFADEGHVEPRKIVPQLHAKLVSEGVTIAYESACNPQDKSGITIDCRGLAAQDVQRELRAVKGEMIIVETDEIDLKRPVRLIHPRWPLYIVPRDNNQFMIGATTIETSDTKLSVRSALEMLSAAYALHPVFAEARIIEFGAGLRPAFPDNLPRIAVHGSHISVNGLYRHGFLLAPALAEITANYLRSGTIVNEVMKCV